MCGETKKKTDDVVLIKNMCEEKKKEIRMKWWNCAKLEENKSHSGWCSDDVAFPLFLLY